MTAPPLYLVADCVLSADGGVRITDIRGGVGGGLHLLASAYGGQVQARHRLQPLVERLRELADGREILIVHDPFVARQTFPDDFFAWVHRFSQYGPVTDWVPDLSDASARVHDPYVPELAEMGTFLDPLAARLKTSIGYCAAVRVEFQAGSPKLLLSGYRRRAGVAPTTRTLNPEEIGVLIFSGVSERFSDDLRNQSWFPCINPPLVDAVLESKWLVPHLLADHPASRLFPRSIPYGMGLRSSEEIQAFAAGLESPAGFPLAVLRPSRQSLRPGIRFLDRTALRALAARQPSRRLPAHLGEELVRTRVAHAYSEISQYRGKQLDNLMRVAGAEVHDHGDGSFHFSAPYPFLESTAGTLQEYVESRPLRSRRTGKLHRGSVRAVFFERRLVSAIARLTQDVDDGTFRDPSRADTATFCEGLGAEESGLLVREVTPLLEELESRLIARVNRSHGPLELLDEWVRAQTR